MNADPISAIYTSQKSTKEVFYKELEADLRSRKTIGWRQKPYIRNQNPCQDLPQTYGGGEIHMSGLDMSHRRFSITPKDKY